MNEGGLYIGVNELPMRYPKFCSDDFVILKLTPRYQNGEWVKWHQQVDSGCINGKNVLAEEFRNLKLGYRGDLKFEKNSEIFEISEALQMRVIDAHTMQGFYS